MFVLPLVNFYNFMMLASRVIRVKFHYCDDYITEDCMVTSTWHWECMMRLLMLIGFTVVTMHLSLPMPKVLRRCGRVGRGGRKMWEPRVE